ncbi:MAG: hypothetical protein U9Q05_13695 [Thermodesulfobacteriota bacterium]|nr:hypothetical protein [Thermodesulfobacteriota bacterium]
MIRQKETDDRDREGRGSFVFKTIIRYRFVFRNHLIGLIAMTLFLSAGCAHHMPIAKDTVQGLYLFQGNEKDAIHRFAPVFLVYDYNHRHNRIGRPTASREEDGRERITIDIDQPIVYVKKEPFTTSKNSYTNLIYRIHFPAIPFSLVPFNLTAGKNPGLIIVITLNRREEPVIATSVHACGCYKAIVSTTYLPGEALPQKRQKKPVSLSLDVYGEQLPASVDYQSINAPRLLVTLRPDVHRIMDLQVIDGRTLQILQSDLQVRDVSLEPIENLDRLSINGDVTSFYYQEGMMKGHVKGAIKPLETIFLSWASLDLFVGTDKMYGSDDNPFYTSLKPWNRRKSDMNDFARFLQFWGWGL